MRHEADDGEDDEAGKDAGHTVEDRNEACVPASDQQVIIVVVTQTIFHTGTNILVNFQEYSRKKSRKYRQNLSLYFYL